MLSYKQDILDIPRALRETLHQGRSEYESLVRRTRWGEGPIFIVGHGATFLAGLVATYAFEGLLGWPVIARPTSVFHNYSLALLRPRSVVLALEGSGNETGLVEAIRAARSRGASVLVMACDQTSPAAQAADETFLVRAGEGLEDGPKALVLKHAAVTYLALVAARVLKRHHPQLDLLDQDFVKLPEHLEWVQTQMAGALRGFAAELAGLSRVLVVGGGPYHPAALLAAYLMRAWAGFEAQASDVPSIRDITSAVAGRDFGVCFLSGSKCRVKKEVHLAAADLKKAGAKVFSLTDGNDRELAERSALAFLFPPLPELAGSMLVLALGAAVAGHLADKSKEGLAASRHYQVSSENKGKAPGD